jgi:hypothetical protein
MDDLFGNMVFVNMGMTVNDGKIPAHCQIVTFYKFLFNVSIFRFFTIFFALLSAALYAR